MWTLARKLLFHDRLRFAVAIAGVSVSVMLVLVQVGLYFGFMDTASSLIDASHADLWVGKKGNESFEFATPFDERAFLPAEPYVDTRPPPEPEPSVQTWPVKSYNPLETLLLSLRRPYSFSLGFATGSLGFADLAIAQEKPAAVPATSDSAKPADKSAAQPAQPVSYKQQKDVVFGEADGVGLAMDIFTPVGKRNGVALIDVVSGAWYSDRGKLRDHERAQFFQIFCSRGYTVFAIRPGSRDRFSAQDRHETQRFGGADFDESWAQRTPAREIRVDQRCFSSRRDHDVLAGVPLPRSREDRQGDGGQDADRSLPHD